VNFHPTPLNIAWTLITGGAAIIALLSALQILISIIPELKNRKAWDFGAVKAVVHNYLRRDLFRAIRLTSYALLGVFAMFVSTPVHQDVKNFQLLASLVLIGGVICEVLDAAFDFYYRYHWLRPISLPPNVQQKIVRDRQERKDKGRKREIDPREPDA
jgi:hypothetical protein